MSAERTQTSEAKRVRIETASAASPAASSPLRPGLTVPDSLSAHRSSFLSSKDSPYSHVVIERLCDPARLKTIKDEIVNNLTSKFKETDLFKVYQTTDLANLQADCGNEEEKALAAALPNLLALRDALYAPEFRSFISSMTGCGALTEQTDMAASAYGHGCHLLCHDDVIGKRAISFIVYLTDDGWTADDGGALELYPLVDGGQLGPSGSPQGVPETEPAVSILPLFNTMALFRVEPGRSYHSVQEVFTSHTPRLSIQGWYHAPHEPEGAEMASINQLKSATAEASTLFLPFKSTSDSTSGDKAIALTCSSLSEEDVKYLTPWINGVYLQPKFLDSVRERFENDSSVQLRDFLSHEAFQLLYEKCMDEDGEDGLLEPRRPGFSVGADRVGWETVGPAHMQRYLKYDGESPEGTAGRHLEAIKDVFQSQSFAKLLRDITGGNILGQKTEARRFRAGLDYTVAHFGLLEPVARLDVTLCVVKGRITADNEPDENIMIWESGDVGGFDCFMAAEEEENVAAEVYCDDDDAVSLYFPHLSLSLVPSLTKTKNNVNL